MKKRVLRLAIGLTVLGLTQPGHAEVPAGTLGASEASYQSIIALAQATRFLDQAAFGASLVEAQTLAEQILAVGHRQALESWIDAQFLLPPTRHEDRMRQMLIEDGVDLGNGDNHVDIYNADDYRYHAWWDIALTAPDQLTQRLAWALSQVLVVNDFDSQFRSSDRDAFGVLRYFGPSDYYDALVDGTVGDYEQLLTAVSTHPVMGDFLSHVNNQKASGSRFPDENYAREVMQLFSIGIYELDPDGGFLTDSSGDLVETYDNDVIRTLARVFTGWHYAGQNFGSNSRTWSQPMVNDSRRHDDDAKDLTALRGGVLIPAGTSAEEELALVMDMLVNHPNTAPFISRQLIQRFTMSNPSAAYVGEVANVFRATNGNLREVTKALLLSAHNLDNYRYEPMVSRYSGRVTGIQVYNGGTERTRLVEPVVRFAKFLKLHDATTTYRNGRYAFPDLSNALGQAPYRSPTVFNYFSHDYTGFGQLAEYVPVDAVQDTLYVPEFQLVDTTSIVDTADFYRDWLLEGPDDGVYYRLQRGGGERVEREMRVSLDFDLWQGAFDYGGVRALFDLVNLHMCSGNVSQAYIRDMYRILRMEADGPADYVPGTVLALIESPQCLVR